MLDLVREALVTALQLDTAPATIAPDDPLWAPHIRLDSLGYHRLIVELEGRLGVRFSEDELDEAIFETVDDIVRFLADRPAAP